MHVLVSLI